MLRLDFGVHNLEGSVSATSRRNAGAPRKATLVLRACASSRVLLRTAVLMPSVSFSQPRSISATIDTSKRGSPISKNIYGQFLEHGGDIVNSGVWAEMLVNRKFFYPGASSAPTPPPVIANAGGKSRFRRTSKRWWAPVGGDSVVTMDTNSPYTGGHTPLVKLDAKEAHGLSESGIAVRKGKAYTGRISLASSPGAVVKVALIWEKETADCQVITIRQLGSAYRRFPLHLTALADSDDATLEITGTGMGSFTWGQFH